MDSYGTFQFEPHYAARRVCSGPVHAHSFLVTGVSYLFIYSAHFFQFRLLYLWSSIPPRITSVTKCSHSDVRHFEPWWLPLSAHTLYGYNSGELLQLYLVDQVYFDGWPAISREISRLYSFWQTIVSLQKAGSERCPNVLTLEQEGADEVGLLCLLHCLDLIASWILFSSIKFCRSFL